MKWRLGVDVDGDDEEDLVIESTNGVSVHGELPVTWKRLVIAIITSVVGLAVYL